MFTLFVLFLINVKKKPFQKIEPSRVLYLMAVVLTCKYACMGSHKQELSPYFQDLNEVYNIHKVIKRQDMSRSVPNQITVPNQNHATSNLQSSTFGK